MYRPTNVFKAFPYRKLGILIFSEYSLIFLLGIIIGYIIAFAKQNIFSVGFFPSHRNTIFLNNSNNEEAADLNLYGGTLFKGNGYESQDKVRIGCLVMTFLQNHESKAKFVKNTWGSRCNTLAFMSSVDDPLLGSIDLHIPERRNSLWYKTKASFLYAYKHFLDNADWFLKADDDTYIIMENLKYMLAAYNSSEPIYFGHRFRPFLKQGYMSGGAGYVLSKRAVILFAKLGILEGKCWDFIDSEDVQVGKCMEVVGVKAVDTRDSLGRERFFPFIPKRLFIPGHQTPNNWYSQFKYYLEGSECCSDSAISLHYVIGDMMNMLDFIVYHLRPYGSNYLFNIPSPNSSVENNYQSN